MQTFSKENLKIIFDEQTDRKRIVTNINGYPQVSYEESIIIWVSILFSNLLVKSYDINIVYCFINMFVEKNFLTTV